MKKKYVRSYNEIWNERKRTVGSMLLLFAVIMVAIMGVRTVQGMLDLTKIKDILVAPTEQHKYENLHNASRYFFRIYYPDNWQAEGETNGFMMDDKTGLVAILYPLVYADPVTPGPSAGPSATAVVSFDKVRDKSLTASFYYKNYTEDMLERAKQQDAGSGSGSSTSGRQAEDNDPTAAPVTANSSAVITPDPNAPTPVPVKTDITLLDIAAGDYYEDFKTGTGAGYEVGELKAYNTDQYSFRTFTYAYTDPLLTRHMADVYIVARSSNYIVIVYEATGPLAKGGTPESYTLYKDAFLDILNEFRLSVFED